MDCCPLRFPFSIPASSRCAASHFHHIRLNRSTNSITREIQHYANREGRIIVLYDEDESIAPQAATVMVERLIKNVFILSGGERALASPLFVTRPSVRPIRPAPP